MNKKDNKLQSFHPLEWCLLPLTSLLHAPCVWSVDYTPLFLHSTQPPGARECFTWRRAVSHAASWTNIELLQLAFSASPSSPPGHYSQTSPQLASCKSKFSSLQGCLRPNFGSSRLPENFGTRKVWEIFFFFSWQFICCHLCFKFQLQRLSALSD